MTPQRIIAIAAVVVFVFITIAFAGRMYESVEAGDYTVCQDPFDGERHWYVEPGTYWQNFGTCTHLSKSFQHWFSNDDRDGETKDTAIKVRFNDGGHALISGSVRVDLPSSTDRLDDLFRSYRSTERIKDELIRTVIEKSVYMTGTLMSSKESSNEKRNDLLTYIEDQATNGVYQTEGVSRKTTDPLTGQEKIITVVEIEKDAKTSAPLRQEESPIKRFGIKLYNLSLKSIDYDNTVNSQIDAQQKAFMQVLTAQAKAKEAEQQAITAEKEGQAKAAEAQWTQEAINAKVIAEAEQRYQVAKLERMAASETKQKEILLGEGEAARKRLVMQADGALEKKLEALTKIHEYWSNAYKTAPVAQTVIGEGSTARGIGGAPDVMNAILGLTARQLAVSPTPGK
jgi:regulator of protease activity HflC (stomatin/prohibitin superfamily)